MLATPTIVIPTTAKKLPNNWHLFKGWRKKKIENRKQVIILPPLPFDKQKSKHSSGR
jgi:hypothetical protein